MARSWTRRGWRGWAMFAVAVLLGGCGALDPKPLTLEDRLAMFPTKELPLEHPVTIRWNAQGVPWIEAASDRDLAFSLGLVHAHLRLGQISLLRRVVQGRLSESAGPFTNDIDRTLRTIDFGYAAADVEAKLPQETRAWLQSFVDGLNWYQGHVKQKPPEYSLLGLRDEPWTIRDLIAIGRLAGTDVNWLVYPTLLRARQTPQWAQIWQRALAAGTDSTPSFDSSGQKALLQQLLKGSSRSGSNAVAVSPAHSESGAALLASDPHLGLTLPNFWLLVGIKSPSYHAVGLMVPGLPIIGLGRNDDIAWSGTNMRAAQSDLYDVSGENLTERRETIRTRLWFDKDVVIRRSKLGPIVSDLSFFPAKPGEVIALRWKGHEASDEFSAFLAAMRATSASEFRQALATYGVGGQNMICATKSGDICQVMAAHMPIREDALPADLVRRPDDPAAAWLGEGNSATMPFALNPPDGVLASANNRPTNAPFPLGFFYPTSERVDRLYALLKAKDKIGIDDLSRLQRDTLSLASLSLRDALAPALSSSSAAPEYVRQLMSWDGRYDADAKGPVLFECLLYELAHRLYEKDGELPGAESDWSYQVHYLPQDLAVRPDRQTIVDASLAAAAKSSEKYPSWGDMHRMRVAHILANLPGIGGSFVVEEYGVGGSRNTVMKTAHGLVNGKHNASYGSQSRQLCDLGDPDSCRFVLFGGEDGWLGSTNYVDQVPLWREGRNIPMPLTPERIAEAFPTRLALNPR